MVMRGEIPDFQAHSLVLLRHNTAILRIGHRPAPPPKAALFMSRGLC
jgi:hypothetical protein